MLRMFEVGDLRLLWHCITQMFCKLKFNLENWTVGCSVFFFFFLMRILMRFIFNLGGNPTSFESMLCNPEWLLIDDLMGIIWKVNSPLTPWICNCLWWDCIIKVKKKKKDGICLSGPECNNTNCCVLFNNIKVWSFSVVRLRYFILDNAALCPSSPSGPLSAYWNWQWECRSKCYPMLLIMLFCSIHTTLIFLPVLHLHKRCDPFSVVTLYLLSSGHVLLSVLLMHMDWSVWIFASVSVPILGGLPAGIQHACLHHKGQNGNDKAIAILSALPWQHRHGCLSQG